ncbi:MULTISPECIES: hypothetical protein [unclassified Nocardioides]|uniref:hypothetical protein n=1 Tax=unclassified Nocardioides TaxID=2615069 RepID=UPI000B197821|nr:MULTISPECIES: hypothetical protein [unclassified Nocardioides]
MGTRSGRRPRALLLYGGAALILVLLVGVGVWLIRDPKDGPPVGDWSSAKDPVVPGKTSVSGNVVTLPDGTTVDAGQPIEVYVVGGAGVYFLPEDDDELHVVSVDGEVSTVGAHPYPDSLHVSPDGRHLAFLEADRMPWKLVVVDLVEGEEIVRSTDGMGHGVGLEELYAELEPAVLGLTDSTAYVLTIDDVVAVDLVSADRSVVEDRAESVLGKPWYDELAATEDVLGPQRPPRSVPRT